MIAARPASTVSPVPDYLRVLVTGVDGASGKATTAALQARGFFILGVDMNSVPNDGDQFVQAPASLNAAYPDMLRRLLREHRIGWLLPTVAEELVIVVELAGELRAQG